MQCGAPGGRSLGQSEEPSTIQVPSLQLPRLCPLRVCVGPGTCTYRILGYFFVFTMWP